MLKNLFTSEVRILLLNMFLMNPAKEYYLRELASRFKRSPRQVSVELNNLSRIGLLHKRISGKQHYFSINTRHVLFEDLQNIFKKTVGLVEFIRRALKPYKEEVDFALLFGSWARGTAVAESDVDLLLIGDLQARRISGTLMQVGQQIEREINFTIFSKNDFLNRNNKNDHFIKSILKEKTIFILGESDAFRKMVGE